MPKVRVKAIRERHPINDLFIQWLDQWAQAAADKGLESRHSYKRAATSVRQYPLALTSARQAASLRNVGKTIVQKLEDHLKEYEQEFGLPVTPEDSVGLSNNSQLNPRTTGESRVARKRKWCPSKADSAIPTTNGQGPSGLTPVKAYIPKRGSGAYAILLALYQHQQDPTSVQPHMHKTELILRAQPHATADFVKPKPNEHYTAWSSMATLISKGLVQKDSHPPKFSLTDAGADLAHNLRQTFATTTPVKDSNPANQMSPNIANQLSPKRPALVQVVSRQFSPAKASPTIANSRIPLLDVCPDEYLYVNESGNELYDQSQALVHIDEISAQFYYLANVRDSLASQQVATKFGDACCSLTTGSSQLAYLPATFCTETAPGWAESSGLGTSQSKSSMNVASQLKSIVEDYSSQLKLASSQLKLASSQLKLASEISSQSKLSMDSISQSTSIMESDAESRDGPGVSSEETESVGEPLFSLKPGQFQVVLVVDYGETSKSVGGSGKEENVLVRELSRLGVAFHRRRLSVGDFAWIAQEIPRPGSAPLPPSPRELLLNCLVERKRMDDLAASIIDHRFGEQKWRLGETGVSRLVYLIEEFGTRPLAGPLGPSQLEQAIVNTQVQDGLFVKRVSNPLESALYLSLLGCALKDYYASRTLLACSSVAHIKDETGKLESYLPPFEVFNKFARKDGPVSVRSIFLRQLMQFNGITGEKAARIVQHYATPKALCQAYTSCSTDKERIGLIQNLNYGSMNRRIGPKIGQIMLMFYWNFGKQTSK